MQPNGFHQSLEQAFPPMSVTIRIKDDIDISRGDMIVPADAVPELIQENFTPESLAAEICGLVEDEKRFVRMQEDFARLRGLLGHSSPSEEVAKWITTLAS